MKKSEMAIRKYFESCDLVFYQNTKNKYPRLINEYIQIKDEFFVLIRESEGSELFSIIKGLLILDAYLQNIINFIDFDDNYFNESEILEYSAKDKAAYYKEAFGYRMNARSPNILLFNILDNEL
ncbi:hypothetical protein FG877_10555 [Enterococcus casseliflavus]|nr:hypothetical protein [Enterococcus casseliflavus]